MGVTENQLFANPVRYIVKIKATCFCLHLGMKRNLKQHIAQLHLQSRSALPVDGLNDLIGLLNKILLDRSMSLRLIPGTAAGGTEQRHNANQILRIIVLFAYKIQCHTDASFDQLVPRNYI